MPPTPRGPTARRTRGKAPQRIPLAPRMPRRCARGRATRWRRRAPCSSAARARGPRSCGRRSNDPPHARYTMLMSLLRVLLPDAPRADRADAWAVFGLDDRALQEGRGTPAEWPRTGRVEAVLAAERVRMVDLALPPLTSERLPAAVAYALEDQVASTDDPPRVAVGAQRADGHVSVALASRALIDSIVGSGAGFARIVPEAALV